MAAAQSLSGRETEPAWTSCIPFSNVIFFIKGLFRLRKILETKRLTEFEKIRIAHCLTLDNY